MKEEILARLDAVAEKLGVAANRMWPLLVRRERVEGITSALLCLFFLVVAGVGIHYQWVQSDCIGTHSNCEGTNIVKVIIYVLSAITSFISLLCLKDAVDKTLCAEAYAFTRLLHSVKG